MKIFINLILSLFLIAASLSVQAYQCPEEMTEGCFPAAPPDRDARIKHSSSGGGIITTGGGSNSGSNTGGSGGSGGGSGSGTSSKTPSQVCLERVNKEFSICKAKASSEFTTTLTTVCLGQGSVSVHGGTPYFGGQVTVDQYNQCKDVAESRRINKVDVCEVFKHTKIASCP